MLRSMNKHKLLSRLSFLRILTGIGAGFFLWIWYRMSEDQEWKEDQEDFRHKGAIPLGVSYYKKYYLYRNKDQVVAFSTVCTHAGCRIGKTNGNFLQCSCHGSRFEAATGKALKGPAIQPLQQLDCQYDSKSCEWIVKMSAGSSQQG